MFLAFFIIIISTVILYKISEKNKAEEEGCEVIEKECSVDYSLMNDDFFKKSVIITVINMIAQELFIFAA